jgi:hypothetical protein
MLPTWKGAIEQQRIEQYRMGYIKSGGDLVIWLDDYYSPATQIFRDM